MSATLLAAAAENREASPIGLEWARFAGHGWAFGGDF